MNLPSLILQSHYPDWPTFIEAVYQAFKEDFVDTKPGYEGKTVNIRVHPLSDGKEATFWHCITNSYDIAIKEEDRFQEPGRCERIKWPRAIIENANDPDIKIWKNKRKTHERTCLCYGDWEYLVVLEERDNHWLLLTAYEIRFAHTQSKLEKEFLAYKP